jgi:DNA-binding SARP family transcriptional activator
VRVTILGPVAVVGGAHRQPLARAQTRGLVALLVLEAGRFVSVDQLIEAVWGGTPPATARTQVQGMISAIRRAVAAAGAPDAIEHGAAGYRLRLEPDGSDTGSDLAEFEAALQTARAAGDPESAVRALRAGLALWQGAPLADATGAFVDAARSRLAERRLVAWELLAEHELALHRHGPLATELASIMDANPQRERLRGQYMLALYRSGQQVAALRTYREYRRQLAAEEGLDPGPELIALELAMLRQDASLDVPPVPVEPVVRVAPAQLPADVAQFTGRQSYLDGLDGLPSGLVTVTGMAGAGKTALAVHWAHRVRASFPDGQLYLDLRGFTPGSAPMRPIDALARLLRGLGVPADQTPLDVDEAGSVYRSLLADRRVLILLDNAADAEQVRPLLPGGAGCLALVTSRDALTGLVAREGARGLSLGALSTSEAGALLARLVGADRVAAEPSAALELLELCAGLPLALRIVAAGLSGLLRDKLGELRGADRLAGMAVTGDPHTAVRTAFGVSYAALPAEAARLFRLAAIVPGEDVTPTAAAALSGLDVAPARQILRQLAAVHLVHEHAPDRFAYHDLLRLYAAERAAEASADEIGPAIGRFLDLALVTTGHAVWRLYPGRTRLPLPDGLGAGLPRLEFAGADEAAAWLDSERVNLVAAVRYAADHGQPAVAWRLADALRSYFSLRAYTVDWMSTAESGLRAARDQADAAGMAAANLSFGELYRRRGDYDVALRHYLQARVLAHDAGWWEAELATVNNLGSTYADTGRLSQAAECYLTALRLNRERGRLGGQGVNLTNLGLVYWEMGRLRDSVGHISQGLELFRKIDSRPGQMAALASLGEVCHALGELTVASAMLDEAMEYCRELGDPTVEVDILRVQALIARDRGDLAGALAITQRAEAVAELIDRHECVVRLHIVSGAVRLARGEMELAQGHFTEALRQARGFDRQYQETEALLGLAAVGRAVPDAQRALELSRRMGYTMLEARAAAVVRELGDAASGIGSVSGSG